MKSMCRDDILRRQVLSTFPPISVTADVRLRQTERGSTDSVSLYSKNKSSNVWSNSNSQNNTISNKPVPSPRKRLTQQRVETDKSTQTTTFPKTARQRRIGVLRERTTLDLDFKDTHSGERDSCKLTSRSNYTSLTQRHDDETDKRRRESSSTNSSSLPKMARKKKASMTIAEEPRPHFQREMTFIIKYGGDDDYTLEKNVSNENRLSFRPTLETAREDDEFDNVGYLQPAKSRSILEWLESCEKARMEPYEESLKETEEHLPTISDCSSV